MKQPAQIERRSGDGIDTVILTRGGITEATITARADGAGLTELLEKAWTEVRSLGATVLRQDVFGTPAQHRSASDILAEICGSVDWPVTWLEEGDTMGESLTGTHIYAVLGTKVKRLGYGGEIVGSVFSDGAAEYCYVGDVVGPDLQNDRKQQARDVFERLETIVGLAGMSFGHVVRTWLYLNRILDWYAGFNEVRTQFFEERGVFDGLVPASTGIGGGNLQGAAIVADALAVRPLEGHGSLKITDVGSPLQCPATEYRSSFSRAIEMDMGEHRRIYVSGTASIDPEGRTAHVGDVGAQIERTLDVVQAILESRDMGWPDVSRATAYVKSGDDAKAYHEALAEQGIPTLPVVLTENNICRKELLFELEVDALKSGSHVVSDLFSSPCDKEQEH